MGPLIITILLAMAHSTIQKSLVDLASSKIIKLPGSPDLEALLQNLLTQSQGSYYKNVNLKISKNKRLSDEESDAPKHLNVGIPEKESKDFITGLNTKLGKVLDGLQHRVMYENTHDPTCSCDYVSKQLPGVIKCECHSNIDDNSPNKRKNKQDKNSKSRTDDKKNKDKKSEEKDLSKLNINDDDRCGCQLFRNNDNTHDLRCKCSSAKVLRNNEIDSNDGYWTSESRQGEKAQNPDSKDDAYYSDDTWSWSREDDSESKNKHDDETQPIVARSKDEGYWTGDAESRQDEGYWSGDAESRKDDESDKEKHLPKRSNNRDDGYWSDDNWCECGLRSSGDNKGTYDLRCNCKSPGRIGSIIKDDRHDGYWSDDNWCECGRLRSSGDAKGTYALRCNCKSPGRIGRIIKDDRDDGYWSDDNWCECGRLRSSEDAKGTFALRCNCKSPGRIRSKTKDERDDGYWSDDNWCECGRLRSSGDNKGTYDIRCNCDPAARAGGFLKDNLEEGYWSDDNWCECGLRSSDDKSNIKDLRCRCNSPARFGNNRDKSDSDRCGCQLLRASGDEKTHVLRCGCNSRSQTRLGSQRDHGKDDSLLLDDNRCGCTLLRSPRHNEGILNLRCRCNSPARIGGSIKDDRYDGYWSDDNWCECGLRSSDNDKGTHNLRCRCNSPIRAGDVDSSILANYKRDKQVNGAKLSDLEIENDIEPTSINTRIDSSDYQSINTLVNYILKKENDVDMSNLPKKKRKILHKLRDIVPPLRDVDTERLKDRIVSILLDRNAQRMRSSKEGSGAKEVKVVKVLLEPKNEEGYRRTSETSIGVPFTLELEALAQVNA